MGITPFQYRQMIGRLGASAEAGTTREAVESEGGLHDEIIKWCLGQWPRCKYIHSRMDRRPTIEAGTADFIIFLPKGRVICVECKTRTGKQSKEQLVWAAEMKQLDHKVHVVRSFEDFLKLVSE